jgi:hypothetical protein
VISDRVRLEALDTLLAARLAHTRWVEAAVGLEDPCVAEEHTDCLFGKWLLAVDAKLGALPEFQALIAPHKALHDSYKLLRRNPGHAPLREEIRAASRALIQRIDDLERVLSKRQRATATG